MRYTDSFVQQLHGLGAPVERLLNQVNLSEEMLLDRDAFIAAQQLWRFTALAAEYTGCLNLGLNSGLTPLEEHSQFGKNLVFAPTLYQAFRLFCQMAPSELTNAEFSLKYERGTAWFCGGPVYGTEPEVLQVGMYRIAMFVQLVRWVNGPDWQPRRIRLQVPSLQPQFDNELIRNSMLQFGCPEPAVEVPLALLSRKLAPSLVEPPPEPVFQADTPLDYRDRIKQLLRSHIRNRKLGIEQFARSLDLPVRSLQRELAEHGLVYSELVEQTRVELASELLQATHLKIGDIARIVGYSESTHFSRAFRRVTGNTPRHYRQHLRV